MPRQPDNSEPDSALSHPELNPLLNPVLGDHMGQWAEVYFTSPPEKREEAVLQLLRELGGDARLRNGENGSEAEIRATEGDTSATHQISHVDEQNGPPEITCGACGAQNPRQRFCGMCGAEIEQRDFLEDRAAPLGSPIIAGEMGSREEGDRHFQGWRTAGWDGESSRGDEEYLSEREPEAYDGPRLIPEYEPIPYRYRMYVGIALAILVAGLVYVAWQGTHAVPGSSRTLPPAAPAAAPAKTAQPQPTPASRADGDKARTPNPGTSVAVSTPSKSAKPEVHPRPTGPSAAPVAKASAAANTPNLSAQSPSQSSRARGNGFEELAIAENYLNGTQGKASDSAEAAKWLWKSVAKQNSSAALILSDLYLRGNGVAKSCDQARLLLDIAARKGAAGAADRLRNLQAFACQ